MKAVRAVPLHHGGAKRPQPSPPLPPPAAKRPAHALPPFDPRTYTVEAADGISGAGDVNLLTLGSCVLARLDAWDTRAQRFVRGLGQFSQHYDTLSFHLLPLALMSNSHAANANVFPWLLELETHILQMRFETRQIDPAGYLAQAAGTLLEGPLTDPHLCERVACAENTGLSPHHCVTQVYSMRFEDCFTLVASRLAYLSDGRAYFSARCLGEVAICVHRRLVSACHTRLTNMLWRVFQRPLDPRLAKLYTRVRAHACEVRDGASAAGAQFSKGKENVRPFAQALSLAPTCIRNGWAILEREGRVRYDHIKDLVLFFREANVTLDDLWAHWSAAARKRWRPESKLKTDQLGIKNLYNPKYKPASCKSIRAAKYFKCVSGDIEDLNAYACCAEACNAEVERPRKWHPLVAFKCAAAADEIFKKATR